MVVVASLGSQLFNPLPSAADIGWARLNSLGLYFKMGSCTMHSCKGTRGQLTGTKCYKAFKAVVSRLAISTLHHTCHGCMDWEHVHKLTLHGLLRCCNRSEVVLCSCLKVEVAAYITCFLYTIAEMHFTHLHLRDCMHVRDTFMRDGRGTVAMAWNLL